MRILLRLSLAFVASAAFFTHVWAAPVIMKVEPPNWWVGHSWNPVRLLIEGRDLTGARLAPVAGLTPGAATVSAKGNWALVDLTIAADAKPGRRTLTLTTPSGSTAVPFELLRPLPAQGRFQGFSPIESRFIP